MRTECTLRPNALVSYDQNIDDIYQRAGFFLVLLLVLSTKYTQHLSACRVLSCPVTCVINNNF